MKNNKATGEDEISTDLLKLCDGKMMNKIQNILNEILRSEYIPNEWIESTLILIHKKGDRANISNYRPISKTSHFYKFFVKIILNRISIELDKHQSTNQAAFRSGFSTIDHIFTIEQLLEKCNEFQIPVFLAFVDYNKAFDSIEHSFLWTAMNEQGIKHKYIRIMKKIYDNSTCKINIDNFSRPFKIKRGIRQGCCVSPKLINAALEKIFKNIDWSKYGININNEKLYELRFADDVVLISHSKSEILEMMEKLFDESKKAGLMINENKTKILSNIEDYNYSINGKNIERVSEFKYLGRLIGLENEVDKEIDARITNAWKSFWSLKRFFKGKFPLYHKKRLMDTCILPILSYGCQCWNLNEAQKLKLSVTQRKMERSMLNLRREEHITNAKIRKRSKIIDVLKFSKKMKWKWAGHVQRYTDGRWTKKIETWNPDGNRKPGRPKVRWKDEIQEEAGLFWRKKCQDRKKWKKMGDSLV